MQIRRLFAAPVAPQHDVQYDVDISVICGLTRRYSFLPYNINNIFTPNSCKTSMLFAYAYSYALENRSVTFICSKKKIQNSLPIFPSGIIPSPEILDKIHMKYASIQKNTLLCYNSLKYYRYIEDDKSLRDYFSNIHMFEQVPELIIIDDISNFLS